MYAAAAVFCVRVAYGLNVIYVGEWGRYSVCIDFRCHCSLYPRKMRVYFSRTTTSTKRSNKRWLLRVCVCDAFVSRLFTIRTARCFSLLVVFCVLTVRCGDDDVFDD